jgi:hypothetical protein
MYYCKKTKDFYTQSAEGHESWNMIQHKIAQQKESKRQFIWYQICFVCYCFHQVANDLDLVGVDPNVHDYETKKLHKDYINCFFVGADIIVIILGLICYDIHWIIMGL